MNDLEYPEEKFNFAVTGSSAMAGRATDVDATPSGIMLHLEEQNKLANILHTFIDNLEKGLVPVLQVIPEKDNAKLTADFTGSKMLSEVKQNNKLIQDAISRVRSISERLNI